MLGSIIPHVAFCVAWWDPPHFCLRPDRLLLSFRVFATRFMLQTVDSSMFFLRLGSQFQSPPERMWPSPAPRLVTTSTGSAYEVMRTLGQGQYGKVYLGRRRGLQELVALKFLQTDNLRHYEREFTSLLLLARAGQHPHVVSLLECDKSVLLPSRHVDGVTKVRVAPRVGEGACSGALQVTVELVVGCRNAPFSCWSSRTAAVLLITLSTLAPLVSRFRV